VVAVALPALAHLPGVGQDLGPGDLLASALGTTFQAPGPRQVDDDAGGRRTAGRGARVHGEAGGGRPGDGGHRWARPPSAQVGSGGGTSPRPSFSWARA